MKRRVKGRPSYVVELTIELQDFNDIHGTYRSGIEQVIGFVKRFRILSGKLRIRITDSPTCPGRQFVHDVVKLILELSAIQKLLVGQPRSFNFCPDADITGFIDPDEMQVEYDPNSCTIKLIK